MPDSTLRELESRHDWLLDGGPDGGEPGPALVIAWSLAEPGRLGESCRIPEEGGVLGRGDDHATLFFAPERPRSAPEGRPLEGRLLSRKQLRLTRAGEALTVENLGARALLLNGARTDGGRLRPGDVLTVENQLVLVVVDRPARWPEVRLEHRFGRPDRWGLVGESPAIQGVRERVAFLADRPDPVLVRGPSGSGKELVARALHADRAGPFVARNAATLPEGLVDAELFGSARNYPNAGMPERAGLIGEADGGTLFLDEIGEMPERTQAHLLRVLDAAGEYQRLGESRTRRSSFRCVGATNRPDGLKHDVEARFAHVLQLGGLDARVEDIPLLAAHLLREAASDPDLADRFFDGEHARIAPGLIEGLLRHPWTTGVRELKKVLWTALASSPGRALVRTSEVEALLSEPVSVAAQDPADLDAHAIRAALEEAEGNVTDAARALGLSSRYALYRRMRKLGIS